MATLAFSLAGCVTVKRVHKTIVAPNVLDATLDQLVERMNTQYKAIQSVNMSVEIAASSGGAHEGEVKEIPTFAGYIFLRKPADLHILLLLPLVRSRAFDMVSDGRSFKLLIPPRSRAITGSDTLDEEEAAKPVEHATGTAVNGLQHRNAGLESLRPNIVREALLVPALAPGEFAIRTQHSRTLPPEQGRKESMEEPDYDVTVIRLPTPQTAEIVRIIHIGRISLLPYQQDIYDRAGNVVTQVYYGKYARTNGIDFPMSLTITRPIDEYTLKIDVTKLQLNVKFDEDQFQLNIPDNIKIEKM